MKLGDFIMKKIIYIVLLLLVIIFYMNVSKQELLPEDSIRFRIIANSNSNLDQGTKMLIKKDLEQNLFKLLENSRSPEETRKIISENETIIKDTIEKYNVTYTMHYGENYFPTKNYKGVTYEEGNYESLVISLGEGKGNNWWCVMYPPLCLLESQGEEYNEVEYKSYFQEILSKLTS